MLIKKFFKNSPPRASFENLALQARSLRAFDFSVFEIQNDEKISLKMLYYGSKRVKSKKNSKCVSFALNQ